MRLALSKAYIRYVFAYVTRELNHPQLLHVRIDVVQGVLMEKVDLLNLLCIP